MTGLINKYRPKTFSEIIGQKEVVQSLLKSLKRKTSHAFLFEGPPGTGKTTMARIIARKVGCTTRNITEIDAATQTGVADVRELTASMQFNPMGESSNRMYIIDECHKLSAGAWTALFKAIEEPPDHTYWGLCTSESIKVPKQIRTRVLQYQLQPVDHEEIFGLLKKIIDAEGFTTSEDVAYFLSEKSEGSPRQAISFLAQCSDCASTKIAARLIRTVMEEGEARELCQALYKGVDWARAMTILKKLNGVSPESIRFAVVRYFNKVAMDAKSAHNAQRSCAVLQAFGNPYPAGITDLSPVVLSLAELLL